MGEIIWALWQDKCAEMSSMLTIQVEEGEVESANSAHLAQLAAVLALPAHAWPAMPSDARSRSGLDR